MNPRHEPVETKREARLPLLLFVDIRYPISDSRYRITQLPHPQTQVLLELLALPRRLLALAL